MGTFSSVGAAPAASSRVTELIGDTPALYCNAAAGVTRRKAALLMSRAPWDGDEADGGGRRSAKCVKSRSSRCLKAAAAVTGGRPHLEHFALINIGCSSEKMGQPREAASGRGTRR